MNIYVGNLSYSLTDDELRGAFEEFGAVSSVQIIHDRESGRSKGFGFVEMEEKEAGEKAIESLDGTPLKGRNLRVNEAHPRKERPPRNDSQW